MGNCFVENQSKILRTPEKTADYGEHRFSLFGIYSYKERESIRLQSDKLIESFHYKVVEKIPLQFQFKNKSVKISLGIERKENLVSIQEEVFINQSVEILALFLLNLS